ncbi:MAG: hypothetical protein QOJ07_3100 [Thermoleophilaceae bacterium]|nr:hypothetical protein [Thermoleophilaceae bacterium]
MIAPDQNELGQKLAPHSDARAPLRARLLAPADLTATELAAWSRLAERAVEPNPFFTPEFVRAALDAGHTDAVLLVVGDDDGWRACVPLRRRIHGRGLMLPCFAAWLPEYAYLGVPLVDFDAIEPATRALVDFAAAQRRTAALFLGPLPSDGPVAIALRAASARRGAQPVVVEAWERAALHRRPEPTYLDDVRPKRRKELRRLRRALERELGGTAQVVNRTGDPQACDEFLSLELDSWKGEQSTALASSARDAGFFRAMCAGLAPAHGVELLALEVDGRTAAMQCNLIAQDHMFGFKVAYDRSLARFSPGALLEVDAIGVFHDSRSLTLADSCAAPDNELMNRLWPDRRPLELLALPTGGALGSLVAPAVAAERSARRAVRAARRRLR